MELDTEESVFVQVPVDLKVTRALTKVDAQQVPDMPDRIIATSGIVYNVPIISRDGKIKLSAIQTIW